MKRFLLALFLILPVQAFAAQWAIVNGSTIVATFSGWSPQGINAALYSLGQNVSIQAVEPSPAASFTIGGVTITPVTVVQPSYDASTQQLVPGTPVLSGGTVTITYTTQALPASTVFAGVLAQGVTVTCAANATVCTSSIAGNYVVPAMSGNAANVAAQTNITAINARVDASTRSTNPIALPLGWTPTYYDASGTAHSFTPPQWAEFSAAMFDYSDAQQLQYWNAVNGGSATYLSPTITLN